MPFIPISSHNDSRIEIYRDLKESYLRPPGRHFIVEGEWLYDRLIESDYCVESILVSSSMADRISARLNENVNIFVADKTLLNQIVGFRFHRGVLACGKRKPEINLDDILRNKPRHLTLVACVDILDPVNLGGILRASLAFGADAVLLSKRCPDPLSRRVLRVSMGAAFKLPVIQVSDLLAKLIDLRDNHETNLIATVLSSDAQDLHRLIRKPRMALLFGSEGVGLQEPWLSACDEQVTIPIRPEVDSLNVAMTAGIFLYHLTLS